MNRKAANTGDLLKQWNSELASNAGGQDQPAMHSTELSQRSLPAGLHPLIHAGHKTTTTSDSSPIYVSSTATFGHPVTALVRSTTLPSADTLPITSTTQYLNEGKGSEGSQQRRPYTTEPARPSFNNNIYRLSEPANIPPLIIGRNNPNGIFCTACGFHNLSHLLTYPNINSNYILPRHFLCHQANQDDTIAIMTALLDLLGTSMSALSKDIQKSRDEGTWTSPAAVSITARLVTEVKPALALMRTRLEEFLDRAYPDAREFHRALLAGLQPRQRADVQGQR